MNKNVKLVYSTNEKLLEKDKNSEKTIDNSKQNLRIWLENKPGGKKATIVRGFNGPKKELLKLSKEIKSLFHVGGTVKNGEIMIQGNVRKEVYNFFIENGFKAKLSGG